MMMPTKVKGEIQLINAAKITRAYRSEYPIEEVDPKSKLTDISFDNGEVLTTDDLWEEFLKANLEEIHRMQQAMQRQRGGPGQLLVPQAIPKGPLRG